MGSRRHLLRGWPPLERSHVHIDAFGQRTDDSLGSVFQTQPSCLMECPNLRSLCMPLHPECYISELAVYLYLLGVIATPQLEGNPTRIV